MSVFEYNPEESAAERTPARRVPRPRTPQAPSRPITRRHVSRLEGRYEDRAGSPYRTRGVASRRAVRRRLDFGTSPVPSERSQRLERRNQLASVRRREQRLGRFNSARARFLQETRASAQVCLIVCWSCRKVLEKDQVEAHFEEDHPQV